MQAPKTDNKPRELVPEGNHVARLYNILYIGTIETPYTNEDGSPKYQNRVRLTFELPNELREFETDGEKVKKPMVISKEMTFSMYKGSLTAQLRTASHALIGQALKDEEAEAFDIDDLLGMACMLEIVHEEYQGSPYAKVVNYSSIPKGMDVPEQVNESTTMSYDSPEEELEKLPEFIREKVKSSKEYRERVGKSDGDDDEINPEDIPF